jgi:hypothetical protein
MAGKRQKLGNRFLRAPKVEAIVQLPDLAFPVEVNLGEYLVRTCDAYTDQPDSCRRKVEHLHF